MREPVTVTVTLAEADLIEAYRLMGRRSRRQARPVIALATILAAILIALVVQFPDARAAFGRSPLLSGLLGAVLLAAAMLMVLIAALPFLIRRASRRSLAENPGLSGPVEYTIGEDAFRIRTAYSDATYPWEKLHGWRENGRIVLILLTRQLFYVVPKEGVPSEAVTLLRDRLGAFSPGE